MKRKRTELTIETDEIWIIRRPGSNCVARCPACRERTTMVSPEEAALLTGLDVRHIYRQVEAGLVHYSETPVGLLFVCSNSILRLVRSRADEP